jgi:hypothetical protein
MPVIKDHFPLRGGITADHAGDRIQASSIKGDDDHRHIW